MNKRKENQIIKKSIKNIINTIKNNAIIILVSAIVSAFVYAIIYPPVSSIFYPKEPKLEIIAVDVTYIPLNNSKNLSLIKFIKDNETITEYSVINEYSVIKIPYCKIEIKNKGDEVAVIDKLTIEILEIIPYITCRPIYPNYNYTIYLNTTDILVKLNLVNDNYIKINPPYFQDFNLSPHFEVSSNGVDSFGVYIITDLPAEYRIKFILHYDSKIAESKDIKIEIV